MSGRRITLAFFIDALGWELGQQLGCFRSVTPHAYRQRTVLGYSCAAQPTILTGMSPAEHGHWAMFYRTEKSALAPVARLAALPAAITGHHRMRHRLLTYHRKRSGFTGYYNFYRIPLELFRLFDVIEKRDIYAPGAFDDGVESIFDVLARETIPYRVWNWRSTLDESFSELERVLAGKPDVRFTLLYTATMDALLHAHISDEDVVAEAVAELEGRVERAVQRAHDTYSEVDVLLFSDHGMLRTERQFDLMATIGELGLKHRRDYLAFYDSTMGRFWFSDDSARRRITDALEELDCGAILPEAELRGEGIHFEDGRFGEVIYLMDPGTLIVPSYMGVKAPPGMHGFTPEHPDSYAILMSSTPLETEPRHISDTFAIMKGLALK